MLAVSVSPNDRPLSLSLSLRLLGRLCGRKLLHRHLGSGQGQPSDLPRKKFKNQKHAQSNNPKMLFHGGGKEVMEW